MDLQLPTRDLAAIFLACARDGDRARIEHPEYVKVFRLQQRACAAGELWSAIAELLDLRNGTHRELCKKPLVYAALCDALVAAAPFGS